MHVPWLLPFSLLRYAEALLFLASNRLECSICYSHDKMHFERQHAILRYKASRAIPRRAVSRPYISPLGERYGDRAASTLIDGKAN